jgi:hypothetical protein
VKRNISRIRFNATDDLWNLFQTTDVLKEDAWTEKVRERLKVFEQDLLRSMKSDGWDGTEDENAVQWSFAGALFYSIIVITTIGKQGNPLLFSSHALGGISSYSSSYKDCFGHHSHGCYDEPPGGDSAVITTPVAVLF